MSKNENPAVNPTEATAPAPARKLPGVDRQPGVSPADLRQARFGTAMRGFDRAEVTAFLLEAADGYEQALRENDRLRQEIGRLEQSLQQFREMEGGMRTMLVSAQKVADDVKESAQQEAARVVKDAEARAELAEQSAHARIEDLQRDIDGLIAKKREAEANVEATIASLRSALDFVREQDKLQTA